VQGSRRAALDGLGRGRVRQRPLRELLRHPRVRVARQEAIPESGGGEDGRVRLHRGLVQPAPEALGPGSAISPQLRKETRLGRLSLKPETVHGKGTTPGQRSSYKSGRLDAPLIRRLEELRGWTWEILEAEWEEGFQRLAEYVGREGHARVPAKHTEAGFGLGTWVANLRQRYNAGRLSASKAERLETLPGWTWDVLATRWQENLETLVRFVDREGHARVPAKHREGGLRLGQWVAIQRENYRKGKLSYDRANLLAQLPGWVWDAREG